MAKTPKEIKEKYPGITLFVDHRGTTRWRYRSKTIRGKLMPGNPGDEEFEKEHKLLVEGEPKKAEVVELPDAALPQTFRSAWKAITSTQDWADLDPATKSKQSRNAKEFLDLPIVPGKEGTWGDVPVADMDDDDLEKIKLRLSVDSKGKPTPSKPWHVKVVLKKIFFYARKRKWRQDDPTDLVKWKRGGAKNGGYVGWKPWPWELRQQFEARHPIGSAARTCYALALFIGNRRGDVARLRWSDLKLVPFEDEWIYVFDYIQNKKVQNDDDMRQIRPLSRMLSEALEPLPRDKEFVLLNGYGVPFSEKSLTGMMAHWTHQAGMPKGYTLHGLRKSYGGDLAEAGASEMQQKDMLGHTTLDEVVNYAKGASKLRLTVEGTRRLEEYHEKRAKKPRLRVVGGGE